MTASRAADVQLSSQSTLTCIALMYPQSWPALNGSSRSNTSTRNALVTRREARVRRCSKPSGSWITSRFSCSMLKPRCSWAEQLGSRAF